jgi:hypothetical protein
VTQAETGEKNVKQAETDGDDAARARTVSDEAEVKNKKSPQ